MKNNPACYLLVCLCCCVGIGHAQQVKETDPAAVLSSYSAWWTYFHEQTPLSAVHYSLDASGKIISKKDLLDSLQTGVYIPLRVSRDMFASTLSPVMIYQLFRLPDDPDNAALRAISATIRNLAYVEARNYAMEGKPLPAYHFTDLTGKKFSNKSTKGKILVLKTWFINCVPCIEEMPALNKLVKSYSDRADVLFVSVAMDGAASLRSFLRKTKFAYGVVPGKKSWLTDTLQAYNYPTHIVVGKDGLVHRVVNTEPELESALARELTLPRN